jgi:hypothetical protein
VRIDGKGQDASVGDPCRLPGGAAVRRAEDAATIATSIQCGWDLGVDGKNGDAASVQW